MPLLQWSLLSHSHLGVVGEDQPHRKSHETDSLDDLCDVVGIFQIHAFGTLFGLQASIELAGHLVDCLDCVVETILRRQRHSRIHDVAKSCEIRKGAGLRESYLEPERDCDMAAIWHNDNVLALRTVSSGM